MKDQSAVLGQLAALSPELERLGTALHEGYELNLVEERLVSRWLREEKLVDDLAEKVERDGPYREDGKPHPLLKILLDARQGADRLAAMLKLPDEERRRPGRPSGDAWSGTRKAGAAAQRRRLGAS